MMLSTMVLPVHRVQKSESFDSSVFFLGRSVELEILRSGTALC